MNVIGAPANTLGFDSNAPLSANDAAVFFHAGYRFVIRYVPRIIAHSNDLTAAEVTAIAGAGLGLMCVQHVEPGEWSPDAEKGARYGWVAAHHAKQCGVLPGTSLALDLESVARHTPAAATVGYCNEWRAMVAAGGYRPILYVGWQCGLSAADLYHKLTFQAYWSSYNLDADQVPLVRGVQMRQSSAEPPSGINFEIDADTTMVDHRGGVPQIMAPSDWLDSL